MKLDKLDKSDTFRLTPSDTFRFQTSGGLAVGKLAWRIEKGESL